MLLKNSSSQYLGKTVNLNGKFLQRNSEQESAVNEISFINVDFKDPAN